MTESCKKASYLRGDHQRKLLMIMMILIINLLKSTWDACNGLTSEYFFQ